MLVYAIIVTIIAVILIVKMFKWKVAFHSITLFCVENFREPTDKEIADCSKRTISKMLRVKE